MGYDLVYLKIHERRRDKSIDARSLGVISKKEIISLTQTKVGKAI